MDMLMVLLIALVVSSMIVYVIYTLGYQSGKERERTQILQYIKTPKLDSKLSSEVRFKVLEAMDMLYKRVLERG